jgi:peptidoglycan/LPS O-acetylase OafA/YrhL
MPPRGVPGAQEGTAAVQTRARLESLTGLRWFAAFAVFLSHVNVLLPLPHLGGLFSIGASGVSLFFILSGFVLTWTFRPDDSPAAFYARRFARIWPLLVLAVVLPTMFALMSSEAESAVSQVTIALSAILLIQAWVPNWILLGASPVTWSLSCEAAFYAIFPFSIRRVFTWSNRRLTAVACLCVAVLWALRVGLWVWYPPQAHLTTLNGFGPEVLGVYSPVARIPQFILGMVVAVAVRRGWRAVSVRTALLTMLIPVAVLWLLDGFTFRSQALFDASDALLTPWYALLIAAVARTDIAGERCFLRRGALVKLGQWSYAFYLFQFTVMLPLALKASPGKQVADFFIHPVQPGWGYLGYDLAALAITLVVSALCYHYFEHPLEIRLRRALLAAVARRSQPQVAAPLAQAMAVIAEPPSPALPPRSDHD